MFMCFLMKAAKRTLFLITRQTQGSEHCWKERQRNGMSGGPRVVEGMTQTSGPTRGRAHTATADVEFLAANANNSLTSKKFLGDNRGKTTNKMATTINYNFLLKHGLRTITIFLRRKRMEGKESLADTLSFSRVLHEQQKHCMQEFDIRICYQRSHNIYLLKIKGNQYNFLDSHSVQNAMISMALQK